ncbi:hypothetical protein [Aestuariibius sp. HNIBRBA575]|uniref:hypothetical protein n=1 Tax=Aestuariibius sp. HNIBRBA575 TaxID=3233343 RepID=UPI0034A14928
MESQNPKLDPQERNMWLAILGLVAVLMIAFLIWGLPALGIAALIAVPVVFVLLIAVSLPNS